MTQEIHLFPEGVLRPADECLFLHPKTRRWVNGMIDEVCKGAGTQRAWMIADDGSTHLVSRHGLKLRTSNAR